MDNDTAPGTRTDRWWVRPLTLLVLLARTPIGGLVELSLAGLVVARRRRAAEPAV